LIKKIDAKYTIEFENEKENNNNKGDCQSRTAIVLFQIDFYLACSMMNEDILLIIMRKKTQFI